MFLKPIAPIRYVKEATWWYYRLTLHSGALTIDVIGPLNPCLLVSTSSRPRNTSITTPLGASTVGEAHDHVRLDSTYLLLAL